MIKSIKQIVEKAANKRKNKSKQRRASARAVKAATFGKQDMRGMIARQMMTANLSISPDQSTGKHGRPLHRKRKHNILRLSIKAKHKRRMKLKTAR